MPVESQPNNKTPRQYACDLNSLHPTTTDFE
jgi:hypothetical protein